MELTIEQALQQGVIAHREGKLEEAERLYRAVLQSQPAHPDANHNLGVLAVSVNKVELALPLFKTALEANPKVEQFWLSYIDALIKEKQFDNAKQVFEQSKKQGVAEGKLNILETRLTRTAQVNEPELVVQNKSLSLSEKRKKLAEQKKQKKAKKQTLKGISPSQAEINNLLRQYQTGLYGDAEKLALSITERFPEHEFGWKALGAILSRTGRFSESLVPNQKSVQLAPQDAEALYNLGGTLKKLGRLKDAEASYMQAIVLKPDFAESHSNLGNTLQELGRLDEAEASCRQAIALKPDYAEVHNNLGITLQKLGRLDEAEASYTQAIALKPDYAEAHNNLGITLQKLGRLDEAEASYTQAIALKPDYAEAHNNLGNTLKELGRLSEAEVSYRQAIVLKPDYAGAHYNLGNTLKELGRLEEALASYTQAIALKPDYAEAHNNLGGTLQELSRLEEAEASYKKAIALKPDYAGAHGNLGNTLKELGRLDEAEVSYRQAIVLKPDFAEAHSNLGNTLKELGRLSEAEVSYRQAIALKPDYAGAHSNLGNMYRELGRAEEAIASYTQAIALKPEDFKTHKQLLKCLFQQDKKSVFFDKLDYLINQDKASAIIGSLTCRSALKYGLEKPNLFCTKPLNYVLHNDLNTRYDFEKTFVKKAKSILNENRILNRRQSLLVNGNQTLGNIFDIKNDDTNEIQNIIRAEVEKYRAKFKKSEEGLIKKMPTEYSLYGWLISMKSGGELKPHIHENGWLSGSIYISVPRKLKVDSGNLVVALGEDNDATESRINEKKTINVVTGSMVLFPASLTHYTIPFESEEDRIVLAFDVKKNDYI